MSDKMKIVMGCSVIRPHCPLCPRESVGRERPGVLPGTTTRTGLPSLSFSSAGMSDFNLGMGNKHWSLLDVAFFPTCDGDGLTRQACTTLLRNDSSFFRAGGKEEVHAVVRDYLPAPFLVDFRKNRFGRVCVVEKHGRWTLRFSAIMMLSFVSECFVPEKHLRANFFRGGFCLLFGYCSCREFFVYCSC